MKGVFFYVLQFLTLTTGFPSDRCLVLNKSCDLHGDNLFFSEAGVTGPECKELCKDASDCSLYTYFGTGSFPYQEFCMLFSYCDTLDDCEDCITANVNSDCTCGINYEGVVNSNNIVGMEEDVPNEQDCRRHCSSDTSCFVYTYYNEDHATNKNLCMLLTEIQNPIHLCENCQTGADKCEGFEECTVGVLDDGNEITSTDLLVTESKSIIYRSGESGCFKTVNGLAVGSGGNGAECGTSGGLAGGGSGHINATNVVLSANKNNIINIGDSTYLKMEGTEDILLNAANGELFDGCRSYGGSGYSGGGGSGDTYTQEAGGEGGTDGADGESNSEWDGGKGSGFDISSIVLKYHHISPGRGGRNSYSSKYRNSWYGGGGGGILVDGLGVEREDGVGEGYGGGGASDSAGGTSASGSQGLIILEL